MSTNVALRLLVLLTFVIGSSACSRLKSFRVNSADADPRPAALPDDDRRVLPDSMPLVLAQDEDYVVRVIAGPATCSGTLIDEDRVLTAHHCVTERDKYGDIVPRDVPADMVRVELGGDYLPWGEVGVRAVVTPACGHAAGEGDIAVLVLERKLIGVATLPPRLDREPSMNEAVRPIGFGRCALSRDGIRRKQRIGGRVDFLRPGRFRLDAAICPGDSGGPAISIDSGELIGVVSASVMDGSESTVGRSEFTRLDRWRSVFSNAKLIAEGATPAELPPIECSEPGAK